MIIKRMAKDESEERRLIKALLDRHYGDLEKGG